ncbi:hypothetical protein WN982_06015 [Paraburkholderia sp. IMGN_8]|uniref:hypothetical protein n=1 Tax=Paraburkholderia sp. IMGN_8 TaxID=3136564 RepID=UPI0031012BCC
MKVTALSTVVALSALFLAPAFASEHMHVNHDHEHTRYQPPGKTQTSTDQSTSAAKPQDNQQTTTDSK